MGSEEILREFPDDVAMADEIDRLRAQAERDRPVIEHQHPWSFIADGDLDYANDEDHDFGVFCGSSYWCAGCIARPPRYYTADRHGGWPNLVSAPNGLRLTIRRDDGTFNMVRRPLCPRPAALDSEVQP